MKPIDLRGPVGWPQEWGYWGRSSRGRQLWGHDGEDRGTYAVGDLNSHLMSWFE